MITRLSTFVATRYVFLWSCILNYTTRSPFDKIPALFYKRKARVFTTNAIDVILVINKHTCRYNRALIETFKWKIMENNQQQCQQSNGLAKVSIASDKNDLQMIRKRRSFRLPAEKSPIITPHRGRHYQLFICIFLHHFRIICKSFAQEHAEISGVTFVGDLRIAQ